jgi:acetyl-CoA acetyltransferase
MSPSEFGRLKVAVVGFASDVVLESDGRNEAELAAPVVDRALAAAGVSPDEVGVVCSAGSEFLSGVVGTVMGAFDAMPCWPPRTHTHLEGDGAFALYEAWVRLMTGAADVALVCAFGRPTAPDPVSVLRLQLDPFLVAPLAPDPRHLAALQARALIESGRCDEDTLVALAARRRGLPVADLAGTPYVASPLRAADCSTACSGAAAVVLAVEHRASSCDRPPAWIAGIEQRIETAELGRRDLTVSVSTREAATRLGLPRSPIDVLEVHAPFSHQELIAVDAIGADRIGVLNPSGGVLPADPLMVSGLIRIGVAAQSILDGQAERSVGHATNGPCLQHNLVCLMERRP